MNIIRKIATVRDHRLTVQLPDSFESQQVEVVIRPLDPALARNEPIESSWQDAFLSVSCWSDDEGAEPMQSWTLQKF